MNYEFTLLETWINPVFLATVQQKALLTQWQEEMHSETERIKNAWRQAACIQQEIPFWKRYVRQHQLAFIELSEKLACLPEGMSVERLSVNTALETLFLFLADSFPQEIDPVLTIQLAAFPALTQSICQSLSVLEQQLKVLPLADALLQEALFPLREWQQDHLFPVSFERIRFIRVLQQSLLHLAKEPHAPANMPYSLIDRFCYINYNSIRFYQTIQSLTRETMDHQRDIMEQLRYLRQLYKHFKHLPVREDLRYQPDGRILARSLSDWLLLQIISKEKESHDHLLEIESLSEEELKGAVKVMTSQTVDEMGLMVRLFFETGLFRNSKMRPVVQLIAKTFRSLTKGVSDDIGEAFLWQSMYKIQLVTLRSVRSALKRMQRKLDVLEDLILSGKPLPTLRK